MDDDQDAPPPPRAKSDWGWLRTWPMLIVAGLAVFIGVKLLVTDESSRSDAGFAMVVLGALVLGAWIALLASHNYSGKG